MANYELHKDYEVIERVTLSDNGAPKRITIDTSNRHAHHARICIEEDMFAAGGRMEKTAIEFYLNRKGVEKFRDALTKVAFSLEDEPK